MVSAANVTKRFDPRSPLVLDGVDLSVEPGEFVAVLGASGCGKSTLLNILAGLDEATSGEVTAAPSALMFQESALLPWLTAARNVDLALRLRGADSAERRSRTQELLELVKLQDAADKRPHELSGGMRQRVALARALAQERDLLLMDEPFGALDAITRDLLHDELERVWRATGRTIVFVTHNVREAVRLGQRVIMMSSRPGRILREWNVADEDRATLPNKLTYHLREEIARHAGR
ncbi:MAG: ABC transporter ATP-binding protein [Promicromonosporaceae bacterium]|nr:ABC transporter ATP-binding protein [Promicromonosporaceae bacterium]